MKQQSQHKSLKDRLNLSIALVDLAGAIIPARHSEQPLYYDDYCRFCTAEGHLECQGHPSDDIADGAMLPYAVQSAPTPEPEPAGYYIEGYCALCQERGFWTCNGHVKGEWRDD